jgi:hypothetical protein
VDVVVLADDIDEEQQQVAAANGDLQMVVPGMPQLGDKSMPIEAETYVRLGIRHSARIKKMKEMQK